MEEPSYVTSLWDKIHELEKKVADLETKIISGDRIYNWNDFSEIDMYKGGITTCDKCGRRYVPGLQNSACPHIKPIQPQYNQR